MNNQKLQFFRELVLKERENTLRIISDIDETWTKNMQDASGNLSNYTIHLADIGTDTQEREKETYILERELKHLRLLDETLKRIDSNNFGTCIYCGEKISEERLKAVPYAVSCIECQKKYEKRNNHNNHYYNHKSYNKKVKFR